MAALVELPAFGGAILREKLDSFCKTFGAGLRNVDAVTLVVVGGGYEIPAIDTVGGPGATIDGCFVDNDMTAGG